MNISAQEWSNTTKALRLSEKLDRLDVKFIEALDGQQWGYAHKLFVKASALHGEIVTLLTQTQEV